MCEEVRDCIMTALEALDEVLGMDDDKVGDVLWDEVNDIYHMLENLAG